MENARSRRLERNRPRKVFASGAGLRPVRGDGGDRLDPRCAVGRRVVGPDQRQAAGEDRRHRDGDDRLARCREGIVLEIHEGERRKIPVLSHSGRRQGKSLRESSGQPRGRRRVHQHGPSPGRRQKTGRGRLPRRDVSVLQRGRRHPPLRAGEAGREGRARRGERLEHDDRGVRVPLRHGLGCRALPRRRERLRGLRRRVLHGGRGPVGEETPRVRADLHRLAGLRRPRGEARRDPAARGDERPLPVGPRGGGGPRPRRQGQRVRPHPHRQGQQLFSSGLSRVGGRRGVPDIRDRPRQPGRQGREGRRLRRGGRGLQRRREDGARGGLRRQGRRRRLPGRSDIRVERFRVQRLRDAAER